MANELFGVARDRLYGDAVHDLSDVQRCGQPIESSDPTSPCCGLALNHQGGCEASLTGDDLEAFEQSGEAGDLIREYLVDSAAGLIALLKA